MKWRGLGKNWRLCSQYMKYGVWNLVHIKRQLVYKFIDIKLGPTLSLDQMWVAIKDLNIFSMVLVGISFIKTNQWRIPKIYIFNSSKQAVILNWWENQNLKVLKKLTRVFLPPPFFDTFSVYIKIAWSKLSGNLKSQEMEGLKKIRSHKSSSQGTHRLHSMAAA